MWKNLFRVTGQVLSTQKRLPLPNLRVEAWDRDLLRDDFLGSAITDRAGGFEIIFDEEFFSRWGLEEVPDLFFRVKKDEQLLLSTEETLLWRAESNMPVQLMVDLEETTPSEETKVDERRPVSLDELRRTVLPEIPAELVRLLARQGIDTIEDYRRAGVASAGIEGFSREHPALRQLESYAQLLSLTEDEGLAASLLRGGYSSSFDVAAKSRSEFVAQTNSFKGGARAAQTYAAAKAQRDYLNNLTFAALAEKENGYGGLTDSLRPGASQLFRPRCQCEDCKSAVSPLAYLADLLSYTLDNVRVNASPLTLDWLQDKFHQPFRTMPASCRSATRTVRQIRLCIEVLRKYLDAKDLPGTLEGALALGRRQRAYLLAAYQMLLANLGTSFDEIRLARSFDPAKRRNLAERLGITLGTGSPDHLDELLLDPDAVPAQLTEEKLEQLFGLQSTKNPTPWNDLPASKVEQWQLARLREIWFAADFPVDNYAQNFAPADEMLPAIDPDVIGVDDFRRPVLKTDPAAADTVFDIWHRRRLWVDEQLFNLASITQIVDGLTVPDLTGMLDAMYQPVQYQGATIAVWPAAVPHSTFNSLISQIESGTDAQAAVGIVTGQLRLTIEGFNRLIQVLRNSNDQDAANLERGDVDEFISILVEARKRALSQNWIQEEVQSELLHGPTEFFGARQFWVSLTEPKEGAWPPAPEPGVPLIDPELISIKGLPDSSIAAPSRVLWLSRSERLKAINQELRQLREANSQAGFSLILQHALGDPAPGDPLPNNLDPNQLRNDLTSTDPAVVQSARDQIQNLLHLDVETFLEIMLISARLEPTEDEWKRIYEVLTTAHKKKREYPVWAAEEAASQVPYWKARKARLPRWRADISSRRLWKEALNKRSRPPIIDPDLISKSYLVNLLGGSALQIWKERAVEIDQWVSEIESVPHNLDALNEFLNDELGSEENELINLRNLADEGENIEPRLQQLNLGLAEFNFIIKILDLATSNAADLLPTEWAEIGSIVIKVRKARAGARWRNREQAAGLELSPDHFKLPPADVETAHRNALKKWRATPTDLFLWRESLQSRIDLQLSVRRSLENAVSEAEGAALPLLRDALVHATDPQNLVLDKKAEAITELLLIDAKNSSCQKTTRAAQAIETIQNLLFSLSTDQLAAYPQLRLVSDNFEQESQWMLSYATWRSAMFVNLYPENILLPSLRKRSSAAFDELLESCRSNRRLSPASACGYAADYSSYFRDVCNIEVEATCLGSTRVDEGDCASKEKTMAADRVLFYLFGRSAINGRLYYSVIDPFDETPAAQTFWREIPELERLGVKEIIGTKLYHVDDLNRYIYLFLRKGDDRDGIAYIRYDLRHREWESSTEDLELPRTIIKTVLVVQSRYVNDPPYIAVNGKDAVYVRSLAENASGWSDQPANPEEDNPQPDEDEADDEWFQYRLITHDSLGDQATEISHLHAVLQVERYQQQPQIQRFPFVLCYEAGGGIKLALINLNSVVWEFWELPGAWVGSTFPIPIHNRTGFTILRREGQQVFGQRMWSDEPQPGPIHHYLNGIEKVIPVSGEHAESSEDRRQFIVKPDGGKANLYFDFLEDNNLNWVEQKHWEVTPRVAELDDDPWPTFAFDITETLSATQLQQKRETTAHWYVENKNGPYAAPNNIVYLQEAYYFVPVQLAFELQRNGHYASALDWYRSVYDFAAPLNFKKIYYGLVEETSLAKSLERPEDWLLDPLNPHSIAATRQNTYTRFTLISIVKCLLDFADAEFTRDTSESVPQARTLYLTALKLLKSPALNQQNSLCQDIIGNIRIEVENSHDAEVRALKERLARIGDAEVLAAVVGRVQKALAAVNGEGLQQALRIADEAAEDGEQTIALSSLIDGRNKNLAQMHRLLRSEPRIAASADRVGGIVGRDFARALSRVLEPRHDQLAGGMTGADTPGGDESAGLAWLSAPKMNRIGVRPGTGTTAASRTDEQLFTSPSASSSASAAGKNRPQVSQWHKLESLARVVPQFTLPPIFDFCVPKNPILNALKLRAELNLYKLRNCRNIAGMLRELEPYAAPTDTTSGLPTIGAGGQLILPGARRITPTPYRYPALIERAKHLAMLAQQIETAFLSMLEKRDLEYYNALRAKQDVRLARAGVTLQNIRTVEAQEGVKLAGLRQERAQKQVAHYAALLEEGISDQETIALALLMGAAGLHTSAGTTAAFTDAAQALSSAAAAISTMAQIVSTYAAFERREQEWELMKTLAEQDVMIAAQEERLAEAHVRVVNQEKLIAEITADHAEATLDFLSNKFTNVELYEWMSNVLERVYSFFLQQATSMAHLAANQLAFERQEVPPPFIQSDYWNTTDEGWGGEKEGSDRRGLTGSARLLQDIYQLDQHAFDTNKRKLQLTKTVSLSRLFPLEFQNFRQTGVLTFSLTMEMFDRDFPGDYLRLIKRISASVIALVPPAQGIRATLTTTGSSRVVIGGDVFQTILLNTGPQRLSLTSPRPQSNLINLETQTEMLEPFEGLGVETTFEFRMERPANLINYDAIADVVLAIDYTALHSYAYRQEVIQSLKPSVLAERPFSFRHEFADQWYDLHNPDQTAQPMTVTFKTTREDFAMNLQNLKIAHLTIFFARKDGATFEIPVNYLRFVPEDESGEIQGSAQTINGMISTRKGNGSGWYAMIGKEPYGVWELSLPNTHVVRSYFGMKLIENVLFMITYAGRTPPWAT